MRFGPKKPESIGHRDHPEALRGEGPMGQQELGWSDRAAANSRPPGTSDGGPAAHGALAGAVSEHEAIMD